jgi:Arc/MetJ-type ribon-helix-helix transcriptional regulator
MPLALDPATEQRIQRELARGPYRESTELINRALDLLESQENWILRNKEAINQRLEESMAQATRGQTYSAEQARALSTKTARSSALSKRSPDDQSSSSASRLLRVDGVGVKGGRGCMVQG